MSTTLVIALFVEGRTDERFLPILIQRTAESILLQHGRKTVDVLEPIITRPRQAFTNHAERILVLARETVGYHILIIHVDADFPTSERALGERIQPGLTRIQEARNNGDRVCEYVIPIIPVQMVEAWMLADAITLHQVLGSGVPLEALSLPARPHQVESVPYPKEMLFTVVSQALGNRARRRRNIHREIILLQELLARRIQLSELQKIPSFLEFERYLRITLQHLQLSD